MFHPLLFLFSFSYYFTCKEKLKCPKMYVNIHAWIIVFMISVNLLISIIIQYISILNESKPFPKFYLKAIILLTLLKLRTVCVGLYFEHPSHWLMTKAKVRHKRAFSQGTYIRASPKWKHDKMHLVGVRSSASLYSTDPLFVHIAF